MRERGDTPTGVQSLPPRARFVPRGGRVLVELTAEARTPGGIVVPETVARGISRGRVLAVGEGARTPFTGERVPVSACAPGDVVRFEHRAALLLEGAQYLLAEGDVLGVEVA